MQIFDIDLYLVVNVKFMSEQFFTLLVKEIGQLFPFQYGTKMVQNYPSFNESHNLTN